MSNDTIDLAAKILDECRARIQTNMARHYRTTKGERCINASGRSSEAFKVEVSERRAALVYKGDDVAPLSSLQTGTTEVPTLAEAGRWREEKIRSGARNVPSANAIVEGIRRRGGTERHFEPQDWVIQPEIDAAMEELRRELPLAARASVRERLFQWRKL